ncbi:glycosyltransferase family 2 protein [Curtobacterium sp. Leaf183]|uniref:glycosyltransferase family 2 protein n=1 Tax=Curtobacterium sp. Leaf183 TaxID=1736291 RepID=UPI0039DFB71A
MGVVIASVGRPRDLSECLRSVAEQGVSADEVIVVAQVTDEATSRTAREAGASVAWVERPGLALALERGIANATTDIIAFIDDDARAHPTWLEQVRDSFISNPRLGLLGGRDNVGGDASTGGAGLPVGLLRRGKVIGNHHRGQGPPRAAHHVKGANMSMRRRAVDSIPLADLVTGSGAQVRNEFVLSLAVLAQGYEVTYDPSIQVDHFPAERGLGDGRVTADPQRTFVRRSNEAAALQFAGMSLTWGVFLIRAIFLGDRGAPGLLLAPVSDQGFVQLRAGVRGLLDGSRRGSRMRRGRVKRVSE